MRLALRAPLRDGVGRAGGARAAAGPAGWSDERLRLGRGGAARALRRRPARRPSPRRWTPTREVLRDAGPRAGHAELLAACAAERDLPAGARGDRPRAVGPRRAARRAAGRAPARPRARRGARAGQRDDRRRGPRGARPRRRRPPAAAGFGCVKVKVGIGDDAGRVAAVRAAVGPGVAIRVDANGAWATPEEALANLRALAPAGLEYAEEPVHGVEALRAVRDAGVVPVAMDETAAEPGAAGRAPRTPSA